jgi:hypothetical protein
MATGRTDLDLGAVRHHFHPDRQHIEDLALCIPHHRDALQGRLTLRAAGHLMRQGSLGMLHRPQRLTVMAWLSTMRLVTSLP